MGYYGSILVNIVRETETGKEWSFRWLCKAVNLPEESEKYQIPECNRTSLIPRIQPGEVANHTIVITALILNGEV